MLAHPAAPPSMPLVFRVGDEAAHALSWEALVGETDFLALNERWPIARLARSRGRLLPRDPVRPLVSPLRLMCVLSAVQIEAAEEWSGIYAAVIQARLSGLSIELTLVASEEELIRAANALGDPSLTVLPCPSPTDSVGLLQLIEKKSPHILHIFAHGRIKSGAKLIEIGTVVDRDRNDGSSSVVIRAEELGLAASRTGTWCVMLNICSGAAAMGEALTHAEEIVTEGVPIAIGMRRQVNELDANAFSRCWYPEIFEACRRAASAGIGKQQLIWADTLVAARRRLRDLHGGDPSEDDIWTLPVMYKLPGTFQLEVPRIGVAESQEWRRLGEGSLQADLIKIVRQDAEGTAAAAALESLF